MDAEKSGTERTLRTHWFLGGHQSEPNLPGIYPIVQLQYSGLGDPIIGCDRQR